MRPARLRIAADQYCILRIEEHHSRRKDHLDALQNLGEPVECRPFANVDHNSRALNLSRFLHQFSEIAK